jgi:hypothetical protein
MKTLKSMKEFQQSEFILEKNQLSQFKGGSGEYMAADDGYREWTEVSCSGGREDRVTMRSDNRLDNTWTGGYEVSRCWV